MKRTLAAAFAALAPLAFAAISFGALPSARADAGAVSTVQLDVEPGGVDATVGMPLAPLERALEEDGLGGVAGTGEVSSYLRDHVHLAYSSDGMAWPARVIGVVRARGPGDGQPAVVATMHFVRPDASPQNALELTDDALMAATLDHRAVVFVRHDFAMGKLDGEPVLAGVLNGSRSTLTLLRPDASWARGVRALVALGIDRLMIGPGLLLLWLLLLTAPLVAMHGRWSGVRTTRGAVRALAVTTLAFVLGQALSFALGALARVAGGRLPAPLIEVPVAQSLALALVAFHTVRPLGRFAGGWLSVVSGMVHGLAFAGMFADVGGFAGTGAMVMVAVGVGGLQILLVGMVAPSLVFLREARVYGVLRAAAASAAAIAALVTVAPTPVVLLVAVAALSLTWLAAVTVGRAHATPRVSA